MNESMIVGLVVLAMGVILEAFPPDHKYHTVISSVGVGMISFGAFLAGLSYER